MTGLRLQAIVCWTKNSAQLITLGIRPCLDVWDAEAGQPDSQRYASNGRSKKTQHNARITEEELMKWISSIPRLWTDPCLLPNSITRLFGAENGITKISHAYMAVCKLNFTESLVNGLQAGILVLHLALRNFKPWTAFRNAESLCQDRDQSGATGGNSHRAKYLASKQQCVARHQ